MDPAVDSRIKPSDVGILALHIECEVRAVEHNSSVELCVMYYGLFHGRMMSCTLIAISLHACGMLPKLPKLDIDYRVGSNSTIRFFNLREL